MLLSVQNLKFYTGRDRKEIFSGDGIDFQLTIGKKLGIVGESGAGKSLTALAIAGLLPEKIKVSGQILWQGKNLITAPEKKWRDLRGKEITTVFQDPLNSLNPLQKIQTQIGEVLTLHSSLKGNAKKRRICELLEMVHLPNTQKFLHSYPHEISGGQCQRVGIAIAVACRPKLIIADEPTASLDTITQKKILELFAEVLADSGTSFIFIGHHLEAVASVTEKILVIYAGRVVEEIKAEKFSKYAVHPFTRLLSGEPETGKFEKNFNSFSEKTGCPFFSHCSVSSVLCTESFPPESFNASDHRYFCHHPIFHRRP